MESLQVVYKKATKTELKHEDIYIDGEFVGYIIKDSPLVGNVLEWHFVSKCKKNNKAAKTRKELLEWLTK